MECNEIKYHLIDKIDGKLPIGLNQEIEKHLESCQSCQDEFIQTGKLLKTISEVDDEKPDASLKANFYSMLNNEIANVKKGKNQKTLLFNRNSILTTLRYAASILVLFALGYITGHQINWRSDTENEIAGLKEEIRMLQQNTYLVSLNQPSASERLKTINTMEKTNSYDKELVKALVNALNNDDNVNVRVAAAYALAKFPDSEFVKLSLIQSLELQTEPIIQISLIGILIDFKDNRAKPAIEKIIKNETVLPEVKKHAEAGLSVFM